MATSERSSGFFRNTCQWAKKRNRRRANYPSPIDQYFKKLEFWRFFPILTTLATCVVANRNDPSLVISDHIARSAPLLLFSMLFLNVAYNLQEAVPEIAVVALLAGLSAVVTSFHGLISMALHFPPATIFIINVGYGSLLLFNVYKIFKEDVREPGQP